MKKSDIPFIFLLAASIIILVYRFLSLDKGFFTFYDEAYFLLKAREVADGIITGKSQWNFIAVNWFPFWDLSSAIYSRAAGNILSIITAIIATIACIVVFGKKHWIKYLSVSLLVMLSIGGQICYVNMQSFLLCSSLSVFFIYAKSNNAIVQRVMLVLTGFLTGLSLFVIMPGGLLSLLGYAIVVLLINRDNLKNGLIQLLFGILGVVLSLAYMHFLVCNLKDVVEAMKFTASYFTKTGYHYDPFSFAIAIALFLRDCIFIFVFYCGAYYIVNKVQLSKAKWLCGLAYMIIIFIYLYYQKKPIISSAMFFSSLVVIPFIFQRQGTFSWKWLFSKEVVLTAFLFCFPLIASMGTNTALSGRIACFLIAWVFIWLGLDTMDSSIKPNWYVTLVAILIMLFPMAKGTVDSIMDTENIYHFEKSNTDFAKVKINAKQKEYFDNVYDLFQEYNYKPDSSIVFTAAFDYATVLAFDAKLSSNFHQLDNFLYWDKSKMLKPDFIILCGWDETVIGEELKKTGWGFPDEFDAYDMGSPETMIITSADIEQRTIYCRKVLKGNQIIP